MSTLALNIGTRARKHVQQVKLAHDIAIHLDHLDEVCPTADMCNWSMTLWCLSAISPRRLTCVEKSYARLTHVIVFSSSSTNVQTLCAHVELIYSLRTGSHKTQNTKVFYEFKIIDFSCILAHLENANIATVAQSKQHIVANCSVFGELVPKYATIPLLLTGYCPLEHWKKIGPKKEKSCFFDGKSAKSFFFGIRAL